MSYKSIHTGQQIDAGVSAALNPDTTPTAGSDALITSGGAKAALDDKQNTLTFDSAPTAGSNNPVTSSGIKSALDNIVGKYNASDVISSAHTVDGFVDVIGRNAKVAVFTATITLTSNVGAWSTFANIQLPPAINMNVVCFVGNAIERVFISPGGNVQLSTGHSTGDIIALNFAYAL